MVATGCGSCFAVVGWAAVGVICCTYEWSLAADAAVVIKRSIFVVGVARFEALAATSLITHSAAGVSSLSTFSSFTCCFTAVEACSLIGCSHFKSLQLHT